MGEWVDLEASDGHKLQAYVAGPQGEPRGGIVVIQEIFGVNVSIQSVADTYAREGYLAVAPALFDRLERGLQLGYGEADLKRAFAIYAGLKPEVQLLDVAAAFRYVKAECGRGVGVVGFCYGGLLAWLSATRGEDLKMQPDCSVGYYAGGVGKVASEEPACPVMLHFGADDDHIGKDQVEAVRNAHPEVTVFMYEGVGHAFANAQRPSYDAHAAGVAFGRSLEFFRTHVG